MKQARSHDTHLRFTRYKIKTALTSFIYLFGNQRPASQRNPHRNGSLILLGHAGRANKAESQMTTQLTYCLSKPVCTEQDQTSYIVVAIMLILCLRIISLINQRHQEKPVALHKLKVVKFTMHYVKHLAQTLNNFRQNSWHSSQLSFVRKAL